MMFRLAVICLTVTCSLLQSEAAPQGPYLEDKDEDREQLRSQFEKFKVTYNKNYEGLEDERRFNIFVENLEKAKRMQEQDRGTAVYGITKFSDMSDEEFDGFYFNPEMGNSTDWPNEAYCSAESGRMANLSVPAKFDWRRRGAVTRVKDQKKCGSCWAFATVANVESTWFIHTKKLKVLSEQELLDCDTWDTACKGGYPRNAYSEIIRLGGLMSGKRYAYTAAKGTCRFKRSAVVAKITSYRNLRPHEEEMKVWLARRGPISVLMNGAALRGYKRGIVRPSFAQCHPGKLTHAVLIVGYGKARGHPYWIIKNSWGANWGEKGYFQIYRGEMACGLNRFPTTAIIN